MDEMLPWLLVQLDEDERKAKAAPMNPVGAVVAGLRAHGLDAQAKGEPESGPLLWAASYVEESTPRPLLHDPERALRDIESKRAIIAEYAHPGYDGGYVDGLGIAVAWIATAYADRPGYREEWRP